MSATMTVTYLLMTLSAVAALAWFVAYVVRFVRNDGYGMLTAHHRPPRSHSAEIGSLSVL